nr:hypothetical protein [uncultured Dyadobacter sp.]
MDNRILNKKLTSFSAHLDVQYGERGAMKREQYEEEFEAFKLGAMIEEPHAQPKPTNDYPLP